MVDKNQIQDKINKSASFYNKYLKLDYQLAEFGFEKIEPFIQGSLGLEIGPSNGYMTKSLVKKFKTLHLVEGSEYLLKQIPDYPNVVKFHSMLEDYESEVPYDTIIMSHVLEHTAHPEIVLKKIYGLLKPDGVFIVSVPNAKSIHRLVAVQMGLLSNEYELNQRDHELGHYRVYDLKILRSQLSHAGFKVETSGGYFLKPLSNGQIEEYWSQEMIQGFNKVGEQFQEFCAEIFAVCKR